MTSLDVDLELIVVENSAEDIHLMCPQNCGFCVCGITEEEAGETVPKWVEINCKVCVYMDLLADFVPTLCYGCGVDIGPYE